MDQLQAHLFRGRLQAEGIPALLLFEHHVSTNWLVSVAIGGVRVQVAERFAAQARKVYRDLMAGAYAIPEEDTDHYQCPRCGRHDVQLHRASWVAAFLMLCVISIPPMFLANRMRCMDCGYQCRRRRFPGAGDQGQTS